MQHWKYPLPENTSLPVEQSQKDDHNSELEAFWALAGPHRSTTAPLQGEVLGLATNGENR